MLTTTIALGLVAGTPLQSKINMGLEEVPQYVGKRKSLGKMAPFPNGLSLSF